MSDRHAVDEVVRVVLLAEHRLGPHDVARFTELHEGRRLQVRLLVPVGARHNPVVERLDELAVGDLGGVLQRPSSTPEEARVRADEALAESLRVLAGAGVEAVGELVEGPDPVPATVAAAAGADEVVVLTEPHLVETALRRDWGSRIRSRVGCPVLHAVSGTDRVL